MEQREEFVAAALLENANISALCRQYGISRKTGHKWINRAEQGLPLCDQSRRPHQQPSKTALEIEQKIVQMRLNCCQTVRVSVLFLHHFLTYPLWHALYI